MRKLREAMDYYRCEKLYFGSRLKALWATIVATFAGEWENGSR